jgi:hypothetical protein
LDSNIYAAPQVDLVDGREADIASPDFYIVSKRKFLLLFFLTCGIYQLYWFYQHWAVQKAKYDLPIWPVARALFPIFFAHSLCERIHEKARARSNQFFWMPRDTATNYVIIAILGQIFGSLWSGGIGLPITLALAYIAFYFRGKTLLSIQQSANFADGDDEGSSNSALDGANAFWIAFGVLYWIIVLFSIYGILMISNII